MAPCTTIPDPSERRPVELGCSVRVRDAEGEDDYTVVTRAEADPTRGRISEASPVGRAILGRRQGDRVDVPTPDGVRRLTIVDVAPAAARPCGAEADPWRP